MGAGECRPARQSRGTQYSKAPSEPPTQPSLSGRARIRLQEDGSGMEDCGGECDIGTVSASQTRILGSQDPDMMRRPSGE